jgi:hypothetical protein
VFVFTALSTLIAGLLFGVLPAWQSSKAELVPMLKDEGSFSNQRDRRFNFRSLLVVGQLALAIVVLVGAGLCVKSLRNLLAIDPGYRTENVLVVPFELDEKKYDDVHGAALERQAFERLATLPGVESVSYGQVIPFSGSRGVSSLFVEGRQPMPNEQMAFDSSTVGPYYHETMGIDLIEGRGFTEQDREGSVPVVIINEALARRLFPGEKALGKRVTLKTNGTGLEIVGITRDVKHHELTEAPLPHFDLPRVAEWLQLIHKYCFENKPSGFFIDERSAQRIAKYRSIVGSPRHLRVVVTGGWHTGGHTPRIDAYRRTRDRCFVAGEHWVIWRDGLDGRTSNQRSWDSHGPWCTARRRSAARAETGSRVDDCWSDSRIDCCAGCDAVHRHSQLYQVKANDPITFFGIALLLIFVSLLACYLPARRATKVDPLVALRNE